MKQTMASRFTIHKASRFAVTVTGMPVIVLAVLAGCGGGVAPVAPLASVQTNPPRAPISLPPRMTIYQWKADFARLGDEIGRAHV